MQSLTQLIQNTSWLTKIEICCRQSCTLLRILGCFFVYYNPKSLYVDVDINVDIMKMFRPYHTHHFKHWLRRTASQDFLYSVNKIGGYGHVFSLWDYIGTAIWRNEGKQIDYVLCTQSPLDHLNAVEVDLLPRRYVYLGYVHHFFSNQ